MRTVKSYIDDLDELEEEKKQRNKAFTLDTKKEAANNLEERNEELKKLIDKHNIRVNTDDTLYFK